jgi:hypothetical protein
MFILNDVDLSNYGRGRDRVKRKSRGNLLRNAAIGVGGLAVAGGLGYLALRGKGKAVTQPSITKPPVTTAKVSSKQRRLNREIALRNMEGKTPGGNYYYLDLDRDNLNEINKAYYKGKKANAPNLEALTKDKKDMERWIKYNVNSVRKSNPAIYKSHINLNNF